MIALEEIRKLSHQSASRIVLLVLDGLGGLPHPDTGRTELESAKKPNLDRIAGESICGLTDQISPGITPGSAPGHLAIFGYDPLRYRVGRGIIAALGIDLELNPGDIAARGNFCTVDSSGTITDRRAGRISTETNTELCRLLNEHIVVSGTQVQATPVKEHRFVLLIRGEGLSPELADSDPQQVGLAPRRIEALSTSAQRTAEIANEFVSEARVVLRDRTPANMVLLRGFSQRPDIPSIPDIYKLNPAAIAVYPMYRGLARLLGMRLLPADENLAQQLETVHRHYEEYDFFFIHYKSTDSRGEDGDFEAKVRAIEEVDNALPQLLNLNPDVLMITGDHSTPATLASHSWHPVPFMLRAKWCRADPVTQFSERACISGTLGRFPAVDIMPLAMAHAMKLDKFGA